jgi:hypothetical protein
MKLFKSITTIIVFIFILFTYSCSAQADKCNGKYRVEQVQGKDYNDLHFQIIEISTGRPLFTTNAQYPTSNDVKAYVFSPDCKKFAAAYHYGNKGDYTWIGIWDIETGRFINALEKSGHLHNLSVEVFNELETKKSTDEKPSPTMNANLHFKYHSWSGFIDRGFGLIFPDIFYKPNDKSGVFIVSATRGHHSSSAINLLICNDGNYLLWGATGDWFYTEDGSFYAKKGKITNNDAIESIRQRIQHHIHTEVIGYEKNSKLLSDIIDKIGLTDSNNDWIHDVYVIRIARGIPSGKVWYIDKKNALRIGGVAESLKNNECFKYIEELSKKIELVNFNFNNYNQIESFTMFMETWWHPGINLSSP